jgi:N-acetylmuramoyl-L-alanine amidase
VRMNKKRYEMAMILATCFGLGVAIASPKPVMVAKKLQNPPHAVVVIDPGHGGKDPGATGPNHIHEKNVVLAISRYIKRDLEKTHWIKAELTRSGDYFVSLRGRLDVARRDHANVFVAIHADAYMRPSAHGGSVFALSEHGASSEAARWVARSENHAYLGGATFHDQPAQVQSVLLDLSQTATINDSLIFGRSIYNAMSKVTHMHANKVEQARFVVLKAPDIPSLLVETGFISNRAEEARLKSSVFQQKIASAIAQGIIAYLKAHPSQNATITTAKPVPLKTKTIKVKTGQSLYAIARQYHTTVKQLKLQNHLQHTQLRIGQTLRVW